MDFPDVTVTARANVYFDGNVVSHTIVDAEGIRRTLGIIRPGSYHFATDAAEHMLITDGACEVSLDGQAKTSRFAAGASFTVPARSGFTITVADGLCQYVCTFLKA